MSIIIKWIIFDIISLISEMICFPIYFFDKDYGAVAWICIAFMLSMINLFKDILLIMNDIPLEDDDNEEDKKEK